ncbi:MAG: hypothetical protein IJ180_01565 [Bacteroidales bacterium]|nr:hypothetical protein [Bacteroidales bacterium]
MGLFDILFGTPEDNKKENKGWFDTTPLDKKYPDAFDDGFGPDYDDNGFNKFDDKDSDW